MSGTADRNDCVPPTSVQLRSEGKVFQVLQGALHLNSPGKSAFPNYWGNVMAWTLAPGPYYVELGLASQRYLYENGRLKDLRVNAGDVIYIGDVGVQGCGWVKMTVTNKWNQVRAKFQETYPNLDYRNARIDLIKITSATYAPGVSVFGTWQPVRPR